MIAKDSFPVYAQYNEDVVLLTLLGDVSKGFYVDVGANHEEYHSVTKIFYEKGWHGINIEPIPRLIKEFDKKRKRDINLAVAVSSQKGTLEFREYPEHDGFSTLSSESKREAQKRKLPYKDYVIQVNSLKNIFAAHKVAQIDFLKIDVEGYEFEVLRSNDWKAWRPKVVCIEANHRDSDWSGYLKSQNYVLAVSDGLNEYYVAEEHSSLLENFAERAAINAHNAIRSHHYKLWSGDIERIRFLENLTDKQDRHIKLLDTYRVLSMKDRSFLGRAKLALKGLTVDYFRSKSKR